MNFQFSKHYYAFSGLLCLLLTCCLGNNAQAQGAIPEKKIDLSYQGKMMSEQMQRPVIDNTGSVNIQMPLYTLEVGDFNIPISMSYYTGGIKVSQRPSVVGLGWNLMCGGVVQRIVRGNVDEYKHLIDYFDNLGYRRVTVKHPKDVSYRGNYSKLDRDDWNTNSFMQDVLNSDDYYYGNTTDNSGLKSVTVDLAPDEFQFNVNGLSGSFFMDHKGKYKVKCNRPVKVNDVLLDHDMTVPKPTEDQYFSYKLPSAIVTIAITDDLGNKYIFGKINDYSAVEFSRGVTPMGEIPYYSDSRFFTNEIATVAWYLSKIITASGDEINYQYKNIHQINSRCSPNIWYVQGGANGGQFGASRMLQKSLVRTPVLEKITTSRGTSVEFNTTNSVQLDNDIFINEKMNKNEYGDIKERMLNDQGFKYFKDIRNESKASMLQLNEIIVKYQGASKERITFSYNNNPAERLKLQAINFFGYWAEKPNTYKFDYNPTMLPGYNSGKEDLLGYNNGTFYFDGFAVDKIYTLSELTNGYLPSRQSNESLVSAESLVKITNPTGGTIEYEYEINSYNGYIKNDDYSLIGLSNSAKIGGQRVRKIKVTAGDGSPQKITSFYYVKDYYNNPSSTISSGVLYDEITQQLITNFTLTGPPAESNWWLNHNILSDRKSNEVPLAYSEITEVENNNGFTIRKFSGYSNGEVDLPPAIVTATTVFPFTNPAKHAYDKRDINRGKLLFEEIYNNDRKLIRKKAYRYFYQDATTLDQIRTVLFMKRQINLQQKAFSFVAIPQYCYNNYVKSIDVTDYDYSTPTIKSITQSSRFFYDHPVYKQFLTKVEKDDNIGNTYITEKKYAADYENQGTVFDHMIGKFMVAPIVDEIITVKSGISAPKPLRKTKIYYNEWASIIKPASIQTAFNNDNIVPGKASQREVVYNDYDSKGNAIEKVTKGEKESYEWGYDGMYPIVRIKNAASAGAKEFYYQSFETNENISFQIPAFTGQCVYTGDFTVPFTKPNSRNYLIDYRYWDGLKWNFALKKYQNGMMLNDGTAIDEVRVYPEDAQMTTYSYDPLIGMTAETDRNGKTVFNEYDRLKRLVVVRDEDKNLIKKIIYSKAGEALTTYYNTAIRSTFTRKCSGIGETKTYIVYGGAYSSVVSQEDADNMAIKDAQEQGELWVQKNGKCEVIPFTTQYIQDGSIPFTAQFENLVTNVVYTFTVNTPAAGVAANLGTIPSGRYNVTITTPSTNYHQFILGTNMSQEGTSSATFSNVTFEYAWQALITINGHN